MQGREISPDKQLFLIPDPAAILMLPYSNDRMVIRAFDIDEALQNSGKDYLLVTGPTEMEVAAERVLSWQVPADTDMKSASVNLLLQSPSGRETFQSFTLMLKDA